MHGLGTGARIDGIGAGPGERRGLAARGFDRHQSACVSATRCGAGLPGLLRAAAEFELLLLRRHVLGLPVGQLVCEFLVQRAMGTDRAGSRSGLPAARAGAVLPGAATVLPRVAIRPAPALGRALGPRMEAASTRLGPVGPSLSAAARTAADLPAPVFR